MPQQWRIHLYQRSRNGASHEQLEREFGLPADELATQLEAARLCFEKQCLLATLDAVEKSLLTRAMAARN